MYQFRSRVVTVATPGTPVSIGAGTVTGFRVEALAANTGRVYLGVVGLQGATGAGVLKSLSALAEDSVGVLDSYERESQKGGNVIDLSQFRLDAAVAAEGVILSYWVV